MDVGLSDNQRELRDSVRAVLAAECPTTFVRASYDDPERWRGLWKTVVDLGWTALAEPEPEMGAVELVLLMEECGRAAAPVPLLSSIGLAAGVGETVRGELAAGAVGALAVAGVGSRTMSPGVRLDSGRLVGVAGVVADAARAELFVVLASGPDGDVASVVRAEGVTLSGDHSLDPSRPVADVSFDVVPESVTPVASGEALARPYTAAAAELVGVASRLLEMGVEYAKTREQFGQAIGSFQGVKHKLADVYVAVERARSLTYLAAMMLDVGQPAWRAGALAKAAASEAAMTAARACVQVHGAIAQTWEHDAHLFVRRAWQAAAAYGDARVLYKEVACS